MIDSELSAIRLLRQSGKLNEAEQHLRVLLKKDQNCSEISHLINIEAVRVFGELGYTEEALAHGRIAVRNADSPVQESNAVRELAIVGFTISDLSLVTDCEAMLGELGSDEIVQINLLTVKMLLAHMNNDFAADLRLARQKLNIIKGLGSDEINLENLAAAYGDVGSRYARIGEHKAAKSALVQSLRIWERIGKRPLAWANAASCLVELDLSDPHGVWHTLQEWSGESTSNTLVRTGIIGLKIRTRYRAGDFHGVIDLEATYLHHLDGVPDQVIDLSALVDLILAHCYLGGQVCQECDIDRFELWKGCTWCNSKPERLRRHLPRVESLLDVLVRTVRRFCLKIGRRTKHELVRLNQLLESVSSALLLIGGSSLHRAVEIEDRFGSIAQLLSETEEPRNKEWIVASVESTFVETGTAESSSRIQVSDFKFISQLLLSRKLQRDEYREGTLVIKVYRDQFWVHLYSSKMGSRVWSVSAIHLTAELRKHLLNVRCGDRMATEATLRSLSDLLRVSEMLGCVRKLGRVRVYLDDQLAGLQIGTLVLTDERGVLTALGSLVGLVSGSYTQGVRSEDSGVGSSVFAADGFRKVGLHELPLGCEEAARVGELLEVRPFLRNEASADRFLDSLRTSRVVHIVTHGDDRHGSNGLLLSDGSNGLCHVSPAMICREKVLVDILFLSCCNGFLRRPTFGYHVSLVNAFLFSGAKCVLYYPRKVRDVEALENAESLYMLLHSGMTVEEALMDMHSVDKGSRVSQIEVAGDSTVRLN